MTQLPQDSRLYKTISDEPITFQEHLLMSIIDAVRQGTYFASVSAMAGVDKRYRAKVLSGAPDPIRKPKDEPRKKVLNVPARDAKAAVSRVIQSKIAVRMAGRA